MDEKGLPVSESLLIVLHNLCATNRDLAKKSDELAQIFQINVSEVNRILDRRVSEGYAVSFTDNEGNRRYYLTGVGIIKVLSYFS